MFSPGLGGNHIANMLSTDERYKTIATIEDYRKHRGQNAHIVIGNLGLLDTAQSTTGNIFCGHFGEFHWKFSENKISKFDNRQIIIINTPNDTNSLAYKRLKKYSKLDEFYVAEQQTLYSIDTFNKLFDEDDFFVIDAEDIFTNSIDKFLKYAINEMNFELNYNECKQMHSIWIKKIEEYINETVS